MAPLRVALVVCLAGACGKGNGGSVPPVAKEDGGRPGDAAVRIELPPRPLGVADLAGYQWRKRAGQVAFKAALKAEGKDWAAVVASCREALAADPTHLEAAWLLAAALGHLDRTAEIVEPLSIAVAGDFGKWGQASLELPAFQAFRATPTGLAWQRRVDEDRAAYLAALARATIVAAEGDLYAFDVREARWHRLTRTGGAVVAALGAPTRELAYITREGPKGKHELAIGVVDLGKGHTTRTTSTGTLGPITIAYSAKAPAGFVVGMGGAKPVWRLLDGVKLDPLPPKTVRPWGRHLEVQSKHARLQALPIPTVTADWDDQGLASAMRIGSSNKVVSVPSPGLIDGNTVAWSPDHSHLAFIAQLQPDATCTPGVARAAAYTADAATGAVQLQFSPAVGAKKIDTGLSVEWMSDRTLVVASGQGVTMIGLDGPAPIPLPGATELVTPRPRPRCTPAEDEEPPVVDDPEPLETSAAGGGGSGSTMVGPK